MPVSEKMCEVTLSLYKKKGCKESGRKGRSRVEYQGGQNGKILNLYDKKY